MTSLQDDALRDDWLGLAGYLAEAVVAGDVTVDAARSELAAAATGVAEHRALSRAAEIATTQLGAESLVASLLQWAAAPVRRGRVTTRHERVSRAIASPRHRRRVITRHRRRVLTCRGGYRGGAAHTASPGVPMRVTRMLRLVAIVMLALPLATAEPAGAATPAQQCTRPPSNTPRGTGRHASRAQRPSDRAEDHRGDQAARLRADRRTGGGGILTGTFKPPGTQTCALIKQPHPLKGSGRIAWTNGKSSTLSLTFSLTGASALANVSGKINSGLFNTQTVSGQFHFTADASHHGTTVAQACASKIAAGKPDRNSVVRLVVHTHEAVHDQVARTA